MTNGQVIVAAVVLIGFFSVLAGLVVLLGSLFNVLFSSERPWMSRQQRIAQLERELGFAEPCNVVRLHSASVDQIRSRRGPAA